MRENLFYHIHKAERNFKDALWQEGAIIDIGKEYNFFYKICIEYNAKYETYEGVPNVSWRNVCRYVLGRKQQCIHEILDVLKKGDQIIGEYQLLLRENAYEEIRKEFFSDLPSRTSCIWLCKEKQVKFWLNQFKDCECRVFMVKVFDKTFKSNNSLIVSPSDSYIQMKQMAQRYWSYTEKEDRDDDEYLYVGKIQVIKEILPDNFRNAD